MIITFTFQCANNFSDIFPDSTDKTGSNSASGQAGTISTNLQVTDMYGNQYPLYNDLAGVKGSVYYFTMWCSICMAHSGEIINNIKPSYTGFNYFLVDYVSSTPSQTRQLSDYFAFTGLIGVLNDGSGSLLSYFHATMSSVVVIDSTGRIQMNEDFKDGSRLRSVLQSL